MATAGLNVDALRRELARCRFELELIEDDFTGDHCVLRVTAMRFPHATAILCYENMGVEPRRALLMQGAAPYLADESLGRWMRAHAGDTTVTLELRGARREDPEAIAVWVAGYLDDGLA